MKRYYYGAWQNFYQLIWPVRFLIELVILFVFLYLIIRIIKKLIKLLRLKACLVKSVVWVITESSYLVGHNSEWVIRIDSWMTEWGRRVLDGKGTNKKKHLVLRFGIATVGIVVYFLAVFVDLPFSKYMDEYYLNELCKTKSFFQRYESIISKGYKEYPPLFVKNRQEEVMTEEVEQDSQTMIYIILNERGKNGANVRQEPSLAGDIVTSINGSSEILYQDKWENDGERYWLKIYLPDKGVGGWLSGKLIDSEQLKLILSSSK